MDKLKQDAIAKMLSTIKFAPLEQLTPKGLIELLQTMVPSNQQRFAKAAVDERQVLEQIEQSGFRLADDSQIEVQTYDLGTDSEMWDFYYTLALYAVASMTPDICQFTDSIYCIYHLKTRKAQIAFLKKKATLAPHSIDPIQFSDFVTAMARQLGNHDLTLAERGPDCGDWAFVDQGGFACVYCRNLKAVVEPFMGQKIKKSALFSPSLLGGSFGAVSGRSVLQIVNEARHAEKLADLL